MAKKPDAAAVLSAKMLQTLEAQRAQGGTEYPPSLERLRELADPQAPPEVALKAIGKPPLSQRAVMAHKKNLAAPIALREDLDRLAGSPAVLDFALRLTCTEAAPTATVAKLKTKLAPQLRGPFAQAVQRQIADNALPPEVEWLPRVKALHPRWLPLPKEPAVDLAERMLRVLEGQRRLGPASYPVRLRRLVELTGLVPRAALLKKALSGEPFAARALPLVPKAADSPVALAEDLEQASGHPELLQLLLETGRTSTTQAFSVAELKTKVAKAAQKPFGDAVARQMETGTLPAGVGWIGTRKQRLLFRLEDVRTARLTVPAAASPPRPPPVNFEASFEEAFTRLDRAAGSHNFVSLVDLRRALPFDRAVFDAQLRRLRESGCYALGAAEGRHGITEEQRAAAITEEGTLLLFVSRR